MKSFIKKIIFYDQIYDFVKKSFFYDLYKKLQASYYDSMNGSPSNDFFVVGVTWTNGKTTVVNLLHKMLNDNLWKTVSISTSDIKLGDEDIKNDKKMSSLNVSDMQSILSNAKNKWCKVAILETTSHWLEQYRFHKIKFDYAVLTNITRDHLDFHDTMQNYIHAKRRLFRYVLQNKNAVKYWSFPMDDRTGKKWNEQMAFDKKITYSINSSSVLRAEKIVESLDNTKFDVVYLWVRHPVTIKLTGQHNVLNFLAALSVWINVWLKIWDCIKSLEEFEWVDGRNEQVVHNWVRYFVDFAHSPDALDKNLRFLSQLKWENKLITVFGAPWCRDEWKRPEMWKIAWRYSNILVATDDDPDTENRLRILNQLTKEIQRVEIPKWQDIFIIPERKFAIKFATQIAKPWDIVLLAGKWHETIQYTNLWKRPRSDKKVLEHYLKTLS